MSLLNGCQYIKAVNGHFEAYTDDGKFICSGDTFKECSHELILSIRAEAEQLQPVVA